MVRACSLESRLSSVLQLFELSIKLRHFLKYKYTRAHFSIRATSEKPNDPFSLILKCVRVVTLGLLVRRTGRLTKYESTATRIEYKILVADPFWDIEIGSHLPGVCHPLNPALLTFLFNNVKTRNLLFIQNFFTSLVCLKNQRSNLWEKN